MTAFRLWMWRRKTRRLPAVRLNAWGYPDVGYW
jgi:hypothetical protein